MAWTEIDDPIMEQEPAATYGIFTASGTIYKGQGVYLVADNKVKVPTAHNVYGIGVAAADASDGEEVAVHSVGTIVKTRISGTADTYGTAVGVGEYGIWTSNNTTYKTAVVVEDATAKNGTGYILITG